MKLTISGSSIVAPCEYFKLVPASLNGILWLLFQLRKDLEGP